jgi:very-short-patch-repair endonuclease
MIQTGLMTRIEPYELETRRVRVGSAYEFQGDERDVLIIGMLDANTPAGKVTGATASSQPEKIYNVAASRARDQLIVVHSFDPELLADTDLRRRLVTFAQHPVRTSEATADLRNLTESKFERDVLERLLSTGLRIDAQHEVAGYRLDFTATDLLGRRAAIECDGNSFHGIDQLAADTRRQRILERLGWRFVRVRASEYYLEPDKAFDTIINQTIEHGITLPE